MLGFSTMSPLAVSKLVKAVENSSCFLVLWEKDGSGLTMERLKAANVAASVNSFVPGNEAVAVEHSLDFVAPTLTAMIKRVNSSACADERRISCSSLSQLKYSLTFQ